VSDVTEEQKTYVVVLTDGWSTSTGEDEMDAIVEPSSAGLRQEWS